MQGSLSLMKQNAQGLVLALFENRLAMLGVAALVFASATVGADLPNAPSGNLPAAWRAVINRVPVMHLAGHDVFRLLGNRLHGAAGSDIGRIAGVLVDRWGQPRAVVVAVGGFLGIGTRQVAVAWQALHFQRQGKRRVLVADLAPGQVARAPQYEPSRRAVSVVSPPEIGYGP